MKSLENALLGTRLKHQVFTTHYDQLYLWDVIGFSMHHVRNPGTSLGLACIMLETLGPH
jgi:hypothetical protein